MKITRFALPIMLIGGVLVAVTLAASFPSSATFPTRRSASDDVAARVGNRTLTLADLDVRWQRDDPAEYIEAVQKIYDGRKRALEVAIGDLLLEAAASSRGMTREQFIALEMAQRLEPVQERDVLAFWAANAEALGGSLDAHRDRLKTALEERARKRAFNALVAELASASGDPVTVSIDPPRQSMPVGDGDPSLGSTAAPVTIVAFSDFQCPFCARVEPTLKQIHRLYGDKVRIVWKDFPLTTIHPEAFKAAEASHCAAEQQRYWAFHDRLFAHQARLSIAELKQHASAVGLDLAPFERCLTSSRHAARVEEGLAAGRTLGVEATPTLFVNGRLVSGAQPLEVLADVVDDELTRAGVAPPKDLRP